MQDATVVVIGAGAAGIMAARQMRENGCKNVIVLEANNRIGGRICNTMTVPKYANFSKLPLELGPEFIHGEKENPVLDYFNQHGVSGKPDAKTISLAWPNYFYFGKEGKLLGGKEAEGDAELSRMLDTFEMTGDLDADLIPEESLLQYMVRMGTPTRVLDMADAIFANDYGNEASKIGLREVAHEQDRWHHGEDYLVWDGCTWTDILTDMAQGLDVRTSWRAAEVVHGGPCGRCRVVRDTGEAIQADRVIVTLPLNVLRDGDVQFKPPLPREKTAAAGVVTQSNCVKVILRLNDRFWPEDCWDVVCADSFMPEVWLTPAAAVLKGSPMSEYYMVGFVAGDRATRIMQLPEAEIARKMCLQLDAMFGSVNKPAPASAACTGFIVQDWSTEALAKGAYSHPSLGAHGMRSALSTPVGALFFAGEATQEDINPCVQGAMETGMRAAAQVRESFQPRAKL